MTTPRPRPAIPALVAAVFALSPVAPAQVAPPSSKPTPGKKVTVPYARIDGVKPGLLSLDVYPLRAERPLPVVVMIHGGGWRTGDKANRAMTQPKIRHFHEHGYVYASINYRLSTTPAVQHPAHVQDVAAALAWIHDNITKHGGDPKRIFVMGHSAGAHLAALVSLDPRHLVARGKDCSIIKGTICLDTAAYDIPRRIREFEGGPKMRSMFETAFGKTEEQWRDASPRHHVAKDRHAAPFLVFHTGKRLAGETLSKALVAALRKVQVPAQAIHAADKDHAGMNRCIGQPGDRYTRLIMAFLRDPSAAGKLKLDSFGRLDQDGNGTLTRAEYARWRRAPVPFEKVDSNGDGVLTTKEALKHPALRARMRGRRGR